VDSSPQGVGYSPTVTEIIIVYIAETGSNVPLILPKGTAKNKSTNLLPVFK
jgi:hypothetical protein